MTDPIHSLGARIGHAIGDAVLFETALTHRSFGMPNNERLEFLGDAVLSLVISEQLYSRFPDRDEGSLSRLRAALVNGDMLGRIARRLELGDLLRLGPGELKSGGFRRTSILAGALEGLVGAVYLEGGFEAARRAILAIFAAELEEVSLTGPEKDPKTRLQEYLQARRRPLPTYRVQSVTGRDHEQQFEVACEVEGLGEPVIGSGSSRRKAEQAAASHALRRLKNAVEGA